MLHRIRIVVLLGLTCSLTAPLNAAIATFGLTVDSVSGVEAAIGVSLTLTGNAGDNIDGIQLSVIGSDALLTDSDTDFSRFSFLLDSATLPGWVELDPLSSDGVGLFAPLDPLTDPPFAVLGTAERIGTLLVDLSGLPGDTDVFVTLAGGPTGFQTDVSGTVNSAPVFSFRDSPDDDVQFAPSPATFSTLAATVPEPGSGITFAGLLLAPLVVVLRRKIASARKR